MLAAMVQSGELPPVAERLPDDPLVLEPFEQTGSYGGELRVARTGPSDWGDMHRGRKAFLFRADPTLNEIIPYGAKGHVLSDDRTVLTIHLREGMKWSDGEPFTTADFMWVYEHVFSDYDIPARARNAFTMAGELARWEADGDYTLRITFPAPVTPTGTKCSRAGCSRRRTTCGSSIRSSTPTRRSSPRRTATTTGSPACWRACPTRPIRSTRARISLRGYRSGATRPPSSMPATPTSSRSTVSAISFPTSTG